MRKISHAIRPILAVCILLTAWQVFSIHYDNSNFPSLTQIFTVWQQHWLTGTLQHDLFTTLYRVALSFSFAMILGVICGILIGHYDKLNQALDPLILFLLNLPALVTIILCYVWIGLVETAAILAVIINKVPMVIVTMREGVRVVDHKLLELAYVYKVSKWRTFWQVYFPQLFPYLLAAARNGLALIWKIVLVVELLGRSDGIGFGIYNLFQFFDIAGILAYAMTFMLIMFAVDVLIFRQLDKLIQRGRN